MTSSDLMLLEKIDDAVISRVLPDDAVIDGIETSIHSNPCRILRPDDSTTDRSVVTKWPVPSEFENWVSIDCFEFCNSYGLIDSLRRCLEQVRSIFSNKRRVFAELDYFRDDDSKDVGHVVIDVKVSSDQELAFQEEDAWCDWFIDNINVEQRKFFALTVVRV